MRAIHPDIGGAASSEASSEALGATVSSHSHRCGPLDIEVRGGPDALTEKVVEALLLFDHRWTSSTRRVRIELGVADDAPLVAGTFLTCARMSVASPGHDVLTASTTVGAAATGHLGDDADDWTLTAPRSALAGGALEDVEDLVGLVLTTGWRRAGHVPIHAAGVVDGDGNCALLCAPSGGGKSSMTAALLRRGWRALGDDKLLARLDDDGVVHVSALLHTFNLHPSTRGWFPEVGDLERLPTYSAWTVKRKVPVASVWTEATAHHGVPTRVVALSRDGRPGTVTASPLSTPDVLSTLLHQTVVPNDPEVAAPTVAVVAACSRQVVGLGVSIGDDAYARPGALDELEALIAR